MNKSQNNRSGQIITFYSYKGGTGRTMALANIGCLLAEQLSGDDKVLMIDWDLEAPGLHQYFQGLLSHKDYSDPKVAVQEAPGLIEMFLKLETLTPNIVPPSGIEEEKHAESAIAQINTNDYVMSTHMPNLYLMKAGSFNEQYADNTGTFNWENLFARSPLLIFYFSQKLASEYKYVLIDSRTGLTDTSGICTMLMPERLVLVFTPNRQSLTGVLDLVRNATDYRRQSEDLRPLLVYPLPSRIETSEPKRRELWRFGNKGLDINGYEPLFENAFKEAYGLNECNLSDYFDEVQVQHVPQYAYGEEIAVHVEKRRDTLSLTRTYENFLEKLIYSNTPWDTISESTVFQYAEAAAEAEKLAKSHESEKIQTKKKTKIIVTTMLLIIISGIGFSAYFDYQRQEEKQMAIQATEQAMAENERQKKLLEEEKRAAREASKEADRAKSESTELRKKVREYEKSLNLLK